MKVVSLTEQDLPDLAQLYRQFRGEKSSLEDMRKTFRRLQINKSYTLLGVREAGRLVGSVMGILCEELYGRCQSFMVVEDMIVDQAYRRRGIGSQLMRAIEEEALRDHCSYIMLVTDALRIEALGFYESLGYRPDKYRACKKYLEGGGEQLPPHRTGVGGELMRDNGYEETGPAAPGTGIGGDNEQGR